MNPIPLDDRLPGLYEPENLRSWRLTKAAIYFLIAAGAIAWLVVDQHRAAAQRELRKSGASIQARVTELESQKGGLLLAISYGFTANGAAVEVRHRKVGDFGGLASGGPVTVWFDPSDPYRCVTENELRHSRFGWTPYLFSGVIVLMMGLAGFQAYQVIQPKRDSFAD